MHALRHVYRNILIETLLLIAVVIQIISGFRLFRVYRKQAVTFFEKLHLWTGLYLAFFFIIHVSAVLGGRFVLHLDTNFYFGVAGINTFPFNLFFVPYYGLAIVAFFGHAASVHNKKMTQPVLGFTPAAQAKLILILGICLTGIAFYGLTNQFNGVPIPPQYNVLIGK